MQAFFRTDPRATVDLAVAHWAIEVWYDLRATEARAEAALRRAGILVTREQRRQRRALHAHYRKHGDYHVPSPSLRPDLH